MAKLRIKKEDSVIVISGKDRDLTKPRRVLQVIPSKQRVMVEGANLIKRHTRPNPQRNIKGGIVEREAPVHVSNLMVVCPECNKPVRVARKVFEDGTRHRVCRKCNGIIDRK